MKKIFAFLVFFLCGFCIALAGCESGNMLRTVSFYEITGAGSEKYTVKVVYAQDKRVDDKYYDLQIKASGDLTILLGKENDEKKTISLNKEWQSLTSLLAKEEGSETFVKGKDAVCDVYIFTSKQTGTVTFRAVVGGVEENASKKGQIITSPEVCSNEFSVEIKTLAKN